MENFELQSGHTMPALGLGTWELRNGQCKTVVKQAVDMGYTHIDTAWMYANQREIGEALQEIGAETGWAVHNFKDLAYAHGTRQRAFPNSMNAWINSGWIT